MQANESRFLTERLPVAIFLHATGRLHFLGCETVDETKIRFAFSDPNGDGDQAELEFEKGAVCSANSLFASQKFLRRKMTETLNRRTEYEYAQYTR